jgi:hypothetical protein
MSAEQFLKIIEFNQYNFSDILSYIILYFAVLWLVCCLWVFKDIASRSHNPLVIVGVFLFVMIFNIPGLVIYMLIRPEKTMEEERALDLYQVSQLDANITSCGECKSLLRKNYNHCTVCGANLHNYCEYCSKEINPIWSNCAYCGKETTDSTAQQLGASIKRYKLYIMVFEYRSMWFTKRILQTVEVTTSTMVRKFTSWFTKTNENLEHMNSKLKLMALSTVYSAKTNTIGEQTENYSTSLTIPASIPTTV